MKKTRSKLNLSRETVSILSGRDMAAIVGGESKDVGATGTCAACTDNTDHSGTPTCY